MDRKSQEVEQTANILPVDHKPCSESFTPTKKPQVQGIKHIDASLVSPTPEKTEETVNKWKKGTEETVNIEGEKESAEILEKYQLLSELFDGMITSLRVLNLRKKLPTFQNLSRMVEVLKGRKFSYKNLAQIKHILPEAVQTDKILVHNEKTLCMEPDIKVALLFDVVEGHTEQSNYMALSRLFFSRLSKLVNAQSEDYDLPEAELPEPFNQKEVTVSAKSLSVKPAIQTPPFLVENEPLHLSHFAPSFRRRFSVKEIGNPIKTERSEAKILPSSDEKVGLNACLEDVKEEKVQVSDGNTPMRKEMVTNAAINVETPDLSTPKRSVATDDNKPKNIVNQNVMASNLIAKRSLNFDEDSASVDGDSTSNIGPSLKD